MVKLLGATMKSKPNFYYIVYDIIFRIQWCFESADQNSKSAECANPAFNFGCVLDSFFRIS